jgi:hypothetical protein
MLENNFCCVRIADLLNSVFLLPWKPWTLHLYLYYHCYQYKTWNLAIQSVYTWWLNELGRWIYKFITNTAWVHARLCKLQKRVHSTRAASDKVYQLLAHGRWFSPGTPASSTTKTSRHDIAEILLKVALNTINKSFNQS